MWTNFKEMPLILKVLTVHAVGCGGFLLGSVVPGLISIAGQPATLEDFWTTGLGVYASAVGVLMPLGGILMVARVHHARAVYLVVLALFMWIPVPALALPGPGPTEFLFVVFAFLYLTGSEAVRKYFAIEVTKDPAGDRSRRSPGTPARGG